MTESDALSDRDDADRIALVRNRWSDDWVLPGENVESGETLREVVVREVREEPGLRVQTEVEAAK